jgi:hypothetical protein
MKRLLSALAVMTLPGFDVHHLGSHEARFKINWCLVADRRMHAPVVVEAFDPGDDVELGLRAGVVAKQMGALSVLKRLSVGVSQQLARLLIDWTIR